MKRQQRLSNWQQLALQRVTIVSNQDANQRYEEYRIKILPLQLDRARRKYVGLVREAKRRKMHFLLTNKEMFEVGNDD